ncbi:hypothetical protein DFH28DRAFT_969020 [Melampsora americana]|nr:hypothetical protein DFH28DRAFT_969020 [Melampsora americana]
MALAAIPSSDSPLDSPTIPSTPLLSPLGRPSTPPRPPGSRQTKRMRLEEAKVKAEEMKEAREDHLKRSNELAQRRLEALEDANRVIRELAKSDAEAKASLTQVNELKVLMMSEDNCQTDVAKDVLRLMQQRLKEKYEAPEASGASTSKN